MEIVRKLWGERLGGQEFPAQKLAPEFFALVPSFVFGMFWARPNLDLRSRSLCTVAQLAAPPVAVATTTSLLLRNSRRYCRIRNPRWKQASIFLPICQSRKLTKNSS